MYELCELGCVCVFLCVCVCVCYMNERECVQKDMMCWICGVGGVGMDR